ncbi:hypothetical protein [Streptomyces sp. IBTA2]|uniref:hypothetical protein n=1 Tax=Streptomyces sp. IBTA2 TaxID=2283625 RepID=UPI001F61474D|nr:hypothetical protein [Streptomyces sp. IBTA2]
MLLAATLATAHRLVRRAQRTAGERTVEADRLKASTAALEADAAHTSDVALPAVVRLVRGGWNTAAALDQVPPPRSQRHRKLLHIVAATVEEQGQQAASFPDGQRPVARGAGGGDRAASARSWRP